MQKKSVVIALYAALVLVGGIMGYIKAESMISLMAGSFTALLLFICSYLIWRGNQVAYKIATGIVTCLLAFFGYRFFGSFKFMPAGLMSIASSALLLYLIPRQIFARTN
jgi:uncharacterized membrane protein (UPF0136 family)